MRDTLHWSVEFSPAAEVDLARLDTPIRKRIVEKIDWLSENFGDVISIPLTGELREFYKLRAGDWRVFYRILWDKRIMRVEYIDHRSNAYRKR